MVFDAVCRNLEVIGEASSQLDQEYKEKNSNIKWRDIKDFRNIVAHQYFKLDKNLIWNVIKSNIPDLKKEIEKLLK